MENEAKGDEKEEKEGKSSKSGPLRADTDIWRRNEYFEAGKSLWNPFGSSRSTPQTRSRPSKMRKSMGSARENKENGFWILDVDPLSSFETASGTI